MNPRDVRRRQMLEGMSDLVLDVWKWCPKLVICTVNSKACNEIEKYQSFHRNWLVKGARSDGFSDYQVQQALDEWAWIEAAA